MSIDRKDKYIYITTGNLKVILSCLGASIVEIKYDDDLLTMTPVNYDDLNREDIYYGKTIGPIANRVKDGLVKIDNKSYYLPLNEDGVCNHSGKGGLSNKLFDVQIEENKVVFIHKDNIFDGEVTYKVIYSFNNNEIRIDYEVKTTNKAVLSITNHTFFTLGEDCIDNLSLWMPADEYVEVDPNNLVPLRKRPINDYLDFNKEKVLKGSYDHCYFLREKRAYLKNNKYKLGIETDYPCLQIYTDNFIDGVSVINTTSKVKRGVAIEPEDSLLNRPLIKNDEQYHRFIIYTFYRF